MRLIVLHPHILNQNCADCRRYIYDDRGQRMQRAGRPIERPAGVPTPCAGCPKQDPADGAYFDRHAADFAWLIRRRYEAMGTGGACFSAAERADPILHRNLGIVEAVLQKLESQERIRQLQSLVGRRPNGRR